MNLELNTKIELINKILDEKKAEDILVIDVREKVNYADYVIIASGQTKNFIQALAGYVEKGLKEQQEVTLHIEGEKDGRWILLDYVDVIVHIFIASEREYYNLEKMLGV